MKIKAVIYHLLIAVFLFLYIYSCKKEPVKFVPTITIVPVNNITENSAVCGGEITSDGGALITARGVCWNTSKNPTATNNKTIDGAEVGIFKSSLTGLSSNTTYYVRAYAANSEGTSYSNELVLKTYTGTVTDADGNTYYTITIGTQVWMAENLKTTKYNDGSNILNFASDDAWKNSYERPAYCWYQNNIEMKDLYGALYSWYTVDTRKLCPKGWHVPTKNEWIQLSNYLGGDEVAGAKLKESGTNHWNFPNTGATNESNFAGLPGGYRAYDGQFYYDRSNGFWWSTDYGPDRPRSLNYNDGKLLAIDGMRAAGYSVRCIKD